jgi:hypothetical protein
MPSSSESPTMLEVIRLCGTATKSHRTLLARARCKPELRMTLFFLKRRQYLNDVLFIVVDESKMPVLSPEYKLFLSMFEIRDENSGKRADHAWFFDGNDECPYRLDIKTKKIIDCRTVRYLV